MNAQSPAQVAVARIEPLAPSRYRLELTVSDDVRAKLERARDLLGQSVPDGNLEAVLDRALDTLLAKLEKERPGDGVPQAVRREVFARDGEHARSSTSTAIAATRACGSSSTTSCLGRSEVHTRRRTCAWCVGRTISCMPTRRSAASTSSAKRTFASD
jgi:hypothetical protein